MAGPASGTAGKPDGPARRILSGRRSRACRRKPGRNPRAGARRSHRLRGNLSSVGSEQAHEGPSGSRLPRGVPRSRSRRVAAPWRNAHRRALEDGAQHHRPAAGALSMPAHRFPPPWSVDEADSKLDRRGSRPPSCSAQVRRRVRDRPTIRHRTSPQRGGAHFRVSRYAMAF